VTSGRPGNSLCTANGRTRWDCWQRLRCFPSRLVRRFGCLVEDRFFKGELDDVRLRERRLVEPQLRDMVELTRLFRDPYGLHRRNRERGRWLGWRHYRLWRGTKRGDRTQDFATITKDNAQVFQVVIGQV